ncbi:hypothetical protein FWF48_02685 [Candidatus Saccharibacteria bacterium]|nr:hypothetical protein [Candidatus Saccharibacteria bacterium]
MTPEDRTAAILANMTLKNKVALAAYMTSVQHGEKSLLYDMLYEDDESVFDRGYKEFRSINGPNVETGNQMAEARQRKMAILMAQIINELTDKKRFLIVNKVFSLNAIDATTAAAIDYIYQRWHVDEYRQAIEGEAV